MPALVQLAGFACLVFTFTLACRPRIRPSPATYGFAIGIDGLCLAFIGGVIALWPTWWLLIPLTLWSAALWVHITRLRDARVMVAVLAANHPVVGAPERYQPPYGQGHDPGDWPPTWHH